MANVELHAYIILDEYRELLVRTGSLHNRAIIKPYPAQELINDHARILWQNLQHSEFALNDADLLESIYERCKFSRENSLYGYLVFERYCFYRARVEDQGEEKDRYASEMHTALVGIAARIFNDVHQTQPPWQKFDIANQIAEQLQVSVFLLTYQMIVWNEFGKLCKQLARRLSLS